MARRPHCDNATALRSAIQVAAGVVVPDHSGMTKVVPFKARGVRVALREGLESRQPLRFQRDGMQPGMIHGFVVGMSREFCLIAEIGDSLRLDGYLAVAIGDLSLVELDPAADFVIKALALRSETLNVPADFKLDDWASIAGSAATQGALISVNMVEDDEGEISYVGQLAGVESDALIMREVDPNAEWYPDTGAYEFELIGSIGFGTGYLDALWQVAGSPADPLKPRAPVSDRLH